MRSVGAVFSSSLVPFAAVSRSLALSISDNAKMDGGTSGRVNCVCASVCFHVYTRRVLVADETTNH